MKRKVNRKRQSLKQKFGFQDGGDVVDSLGYLDSNRDAYSPYKVIPSNEITMKGVSENVMAFPFTSEGQSLGQQMMRPGEEFKFDGADYVVEVPEAELEKFKAGGYMDMYKKGGQMIKRADGSYSRRGLWDNIRANKGSGKKPTKEMLEQERKIKSKKDGGYPKYQNGRNAFGLAEDDVTASQMLDIQAQMNAPFLQDPNFGLAPLPTPRFSQQELLDQRSQFIADQSGNQPVNPVQQGTVANNTNQAVVNPAQQAAQQVQQQTQQQTAANTPNSQASAGQVATSTTTDTDINPTSSAGDLVLPEDGSVDIFNPYGGFDIPTAAFVAGQGIEEGNVGKTVAGAGKFLVGSARNFLSGMSTTRRNNFVMQEAQQRQKEGLTREETLQDGGMLTTQDVDNINAGLEFQFSEDAANALFEKTQPVVAPEVEQPNLGRYGDVGYFDVAKIEGDEIVLNTTNRNPHNASSVKQLIKPLQDMNPGKNISINYLPKRQSGGRLTTEDVEAINADLEFQFSEEAANSLFEKRQPVQAPTVEQPNLGKYGQVGYFDVAKIDGDEITLNTTSRNPHNADSVKQLIRPLQELNPGKKININYLPKKQEGGALTTQDVDAINSGLEFQFSEEAANSLFEKRQPVQAPETYQPNLGKFGEVGYFNVGEVQGNVITLNTTSKNPHNAQTVSQLIPSLKKLNPGKEIRINYIPKAQDGGKLSQILTEGYMQGIDNANFMQPNAEVEAGEYIDSEGEPVKEVIGKKHSEGGELVKLDEEDRILSDHLKLGGANAKHLRDMYDLDVKASNTYSTVLDKFKSKSGLKKILKEKEDIIAQIEKQKDLKDEGTSGLNLEFLSGKLNELDEKQAPLDAQMKELFDETFMLQESKKSMEEQDNEVFELGGMKFNSDQVIAMGKKYNLSPQEAKTYFREFKKGGYKKYQEGGFGTKGSGLRDVPEGQSKDQETGLFGDVDAAAFAETRLKNPWFDWRGFDPNNPQDVLRFQQQFNRMSSDGQQIREDGKFGEQTQSVQLDFTQTQPPVLQNDEIVAPLLTTPIPVPPTPEEEEVEAIEAGNRVDAILLPDQYPLPPDSLQPHLKNQRRFDRIDPNLISPEQQIEEINRNRNQVQKQLNQLPDSQRRAALASLNANTNNQLNQAISEVNRINSQIKTQTDRVNLQQSNMEENFLATDALDFERRQLTALAKTQNDIRNYFNQLRRVQVGNFNTINNLNLLNDLNDDFQFTSSGIEKTSPNPVFTSDAVKRAQAGIPSLSTTPITPAKKKYGGKMKKRKVRRKK